LNYELLIAKRLYSGLNREKKRLSKPIVIIAQTSIALGVAVMLISISVSIGFKKEIKRKTVGFNSHIQIINMDMNHSYETEYIYSDPKLEHNIKNIKDVEYIQKYCTKASVIKTKNKVEGIIIKGVDKNYNFSFFENNLVEGKIPNFNTSTKSNKILISKRLATILKLKLNDTVRAYFMQKHIRLRRFIISGIYDSGMPELDKTFAFADIRHIQKLNNWDNNKISGYEIKQKNSKH